MDEYIMRETNFRSPPPINRRYPYKNNLFMNYITSRNNNQHKNIDIDTFDYINEENINQDNYNNYLFQKSMRYKNDIKYKLNQINDKQNINNNLDNYIDLLQKQNLTLRLYIKQFKKELISKDSEIDGYKEKVKALLNQVKDKNDDLDKKRNVILKLNEEKGMNNIVQTNDDMNNNKTELNLIKIQLKIINREKEKLIKDNKYLNEIVQKFRLLYKNKNNSFKRGQNNNIPIYEQNIKVNEKSIELDSNKNDKIYGNNLIVNKFVLFIKGIKHEDNNDKLLLQKGQQIKKLTKKIEELKKNSEIQLDKYKKEKEDINNKINYFESLLEKKEKIINEIKKENMILNNNLNEKINELNEIKVKNDILITEENSINNINNNDIKKNLETNIRDQKIEIDLKSRENNELQNQIDTIKKEIINKGRIIEELNEDIENLKEMNEYNKKEINEKNSIIDKMNEKINDLENNNKLILKKNQELTKDNDKLYSDNVILKNNVNKLKDDFEKLEKENNNINYKNEQLTNDKKELVEKMITIEDNYNNSQKEIEKIKNINTELMDKIKDYQKNNYTEPEKNNNGQNILKNSILNTLKKSCKTIHENIGDINKNGASENNNIENEEDIKVEENKEEENKNEDNKVINNIFNDNNDINEIKKENDIYQKRIIQLNDTIKDLTNNLNSINIKYQEQKKENKNLKEASQALLEKQKIDLELRDKNEHISPETHFIITKKTYNKLIWYLISTINPKSKNENQFSRYENYKWVTELIIPKTQLNRYNKFEDEENKINDLYSYIAKLKSQLKEKESLKINKKENEKQKFSNNQLQNRTANSNINIKSGTFLLNKVLNKDKSNNINKSNSNQNFTNKYNANSYFGGEQDGNIEIYKNLLNKINDYGEREIKMQNEISKLRTQLKDREIFQSGMNNIKDISHFCDSNFIEDDKDDKNVIDLLSNIKQNDKKEDKKAKDDENFLNILNDVPGNESDLDEVKGLKKLVTFLKNDIKDKDKILNELIEQIKEIIKELKWNTKNNQRVSQILKILGYTPEIIKIIIDNKKGYNFDFNIKLKK